MKQRPLDKSNGRWSRATVGGWYAEEKPPKDPADSPPPAIDVDGNKVTAEDYKGLQAKMTQTAQELSAVKTAAQKYGMSPAEYIEQAEGAFGVAAQLISDGIIDNEGNLVKGKADPPPDRTPDPDQNIRQGDPSQLAKRLDTVEKALSQINDGIGSVRQDNERVMRLELERQLKGKHPSFTQDDTSRVIAKAMNDRKQDVWQHAIDHEASMQEMDFERRKKFASDYGLNFDELEAKRKAASDPNKLPESGPEGGVGALFKGKKFAFPSMRKTGDKQNTVTPLEAMQEAVAAARAREGN